MACRSAKRMQTGIMRGKFLLLLLLLLRQGFINVAHTTKKNQKKLSNTNAGFLSSVSQVWGFMYVGGCKASCRECGMAEVNGENDTSDLLYHEMTHGHCDFLGGKRWCVKSGRGVRVTHLLLEKSFLCKFFVWILPGWISCAGSWIPIGFVGHFSGGNFILQRICAGLSQVKPIFVLIINIETTVDCAWRTFRCIHCPFQAQVDGQQRPVTML